MERITEKIRTLRLQRGYTLEYMGQLLHISQPAYSKLEKNETKLTVERLIEIARVLHIPVIELLEVADFSEAQDTATVSFYEKPYYDSLHISGKIEELYEARLKDKDLMLDQLKKIIEDLSK